MSMTRFLVSAGCGVVVAASLVTSPLIAQSANSLGSVQLMQRVTANGQALAAGTYTVQLSNDPVTPVVGQPAGTTRWVEFVQGGQVKGKELATVLTAAEARQVAKGGSPASGAVKVQALKGADYVRVWLNKGGTQYLVHLGSK